MRLILSMVVMVAMLAVAVPTLKKLQALRVGLEAAPAPAAGAAAPPRSAAGPAAAPRTQKVPTTATVYRWRDENGTIHFESEPPPGDVQAEVLIMKGSKRVPVESQRPETTSPFSVYLPQGRDEIMKRLGETVDSFEERGRIMKDIEKDL